MNDNTNINLQDIPDAGENPQDFYASFKEKLESVETFPKPYIFKFITVTETDHLDRLRKIFPQDTAEISTKPSKNGKYTSVTIKQLVNNADEVIQYYKTVGEINGIIML